MVIRSLMIAVCLLTLWSVLMQWLPEDLDTGQSLWDDNLIAAENCLVATQKKTDYVALLGSSFSQLLHIDSVAGMEVYNLGLGGQGVGDGLNVLAAGATPAIMLIETNIILKEDNEDFGQAVGNPVSVLALQVVPGLRQQFQPVGVGLGLVRRAGQRSEIKADLTDRPINEASLKAKREEYAEPVPAAALRTRLETLRERLKPLEAAGARLVFFETPIHPELCDSPRARSIRDGVKTIFPPATYVYIPQPDCNDYFTSDGHHLGNKSAVTFARWLEQRLEEI